MHQQNIAEDDYLQLSGLQHFAFCRRQWALIHIEHQWVENYHTMDGHIFHRRAHSAPASERRGDTLILRDLRIFSRKMGVSGACDVVEFYLDEKGVALSDHSGRWRPFPVEYKRGKPKDHQADELQLCAQAMCLEEMLCCQISEGALFYGQPHRRQNVEFSNDLRESVVQSFSNMHELMKKGHTPKVKPKKGCAVCSLKDICLPVLCKNRSARQWIAHRLQDGGDS